MKVGDEVSADDWRDKQDEEQRSRRGVGAHSAVVCDRKGTTSRTNLIASFTFNLVSPIQQQTLLSL